MKLSWDDIGSRLFETGVQKGVLYSHIEDEFKNGVPWNGLISVGVNPKGADAFDGKLRSGGHVERVEQGFAEYEGKIAAYTYPDEFEKCLGYEEMIPGMYASQQPHSMFGLSYVTFIGNDIEGTDFGYKIHLVYNCLVEANDKEYTSVKDNIEALELSYDFEAFAVESEYLDNPSCEIICDSRKLTPEQLTTLEDILYGTEESEPRLPYPDELVEILREAGGLDDRLYPADDLIPAEDLLPDEAP